IIERNFHILNARPLRPTRRWYSRMGPLESSLIAAAIATITGNTTGRHRQMSATSSARFARLVPTENAGSSRVPTAEEAIRSLNVPGWELGSSRSSTNSLEATMTGFVGRGRGAIIVVNQDEMRRACVDGTHRSRRSRLALPLVTPAARASNRMHCRGSKQDDRNASQDAAGTTSHARTSLLERRSNEREQMPEIHGKKPTYDSVWRWI